MTVVKPLLLNLLTFCLLLGLPNLVRAQEMELTLSEAITRGLNNNFEIVIEQANLAIAENNNNMGEAGAFPTISFSLGQRNSIFDAIQPSNPFQPRGQIISNSLSPAVNLNWVLFQGFQVSINKERLDLLQQQSAGNVDLVIENTVQAIILAYYTAQLEKERLEVLERILELSRDRFQYVEFKNELGSAVTFELLQEKTAYLTDSSNVVTQQINYKNALRNLNLLLVLDMNTFPELTDSLSFEPEQYDYDVLYNKMVSQNTTLKNAMLNQYIQRNNVNFQQTALYPSLDLAIGGNYTYGRQDNSNAEFGGNFRNPGAVTTQTANYLANFTLSYTLFNGGRIRRAIENARYLEQISNIQTDQTTQSLEMELATAFDLYESRQKLYAITSSNLESAELNLTLAEERYKNGTINSFDYRLIQVDFLNIALNKLQAVYGLLESKTELMRLSGGILQEVSL